MRLLLRIVSGVFWFLFFYGFMRDVLNTPVAREDGTLVRLGDLVDERQTQ